jgi:hypothetical protein
LGLGNCYSQGSSTATVAIHISTVFQQYFRDASSAQLVIPSRFLIERCFFYPTSYAPDFLGSKAASYGPWVLLQPAFWFGVITATIDSVQSGTHRTTNGITICAVKKQHLNIAKVSQVSHEIQRLFFSPSTQI